MLEHRSNAYSHSSFLRRKGFDAYAAISQSHSEASEGERGKSVVVEEEEEDEVREAFAEDTFEES